MITRSYECIDCNALFECDHASGEEDFPDCPACAKVLEWRPKPFAITGIKSKAIDVTQEILENDFGMTNFKEHRHEGDIAAIIPTETTHDRETRMKIEAEVREMAEQVKTPENPAQAAAVDAFWGGPAGQAAAPNTMMAQTLLASAKLGPQAGVDPMRALHTMGKEGKLPNNMRIVARG